ncbi:MAG: 50S ribosomal protein L30e [Thermoplasmata archaeon]|nr:MAG: 50S ribosomal protein L30e [Thermoplasmata archaeon]
MVDIEKTIKTTIKKGKVKIGTKETKQVINSGDAKLVVISKNCPYMKDITSLAKKKKIPVYNIDLNSIELGYTCGKAYAVSVFAVLEDGGSNILNIIKKS